MAKYFLTRRAMSTFSVLVAIETMLLASATVSVEGQSAKASSPELVFSPSDTTKMGILGWPDSNLGIFRLDGVYYVFASNANLGATQGLTTSNLDNLRNDHRILDVHPLRKGGREAFDRDYAGGGAIYFDQASRILIQLYHGEFWYGGGPVVWLPAYTGLGIAVSTDLGKNWRKLGQVIAPCEPRKNQLAADVANGTLVLHPDGYLYAYYLDMVGNDEKIALARAKLSDILSAAKNGTSLPDQGRTFMKYYQGTFSQPGLIDASKPALGGGLFTALFPSNDDTWPSMPSVAFDTAINKYIMAYVAGWDQNKEAGIALRFSRDGLHWEEPIMFQLGKTAFYPTLVNAGDGDPNVLGSKFYIYYVYPFPGVAAQNLMRAMITIE